MGRAMPQARQKPDSVVRPYIRQGFALRGTASGRDEPRRRDAIRDPGDIVPQIDTPLLLDILLGLIVLLFVPFGIRRGVAKEAMVSAGILLGATLADRFGAAWGAELATRFGLEQGTATFAASTALLLACTFLLGYGGGAALGRSRPGTASRLAGGLLAAFNAAFLLSILFGWIDEFLHQGAALDDGIVSEALLRRADLLLLGAAGVLLVLTVLGWIVNASRSRRQPRENGGSQMGGMPARQRPVRMAGDSDAGKYEPGSEPVSRSGRFGQGVEATSPLAMESTYAGEPWSRDGQATAANNGHNRADQIESTRQRAPGCAPLPERRDGVVSRGAPRPATIRSRGVRPPDRGPLPRRGESRTMGAVRSAARGSVPATSFVPSAGQRSSIVCPRPYLERP